MKIKKQKTQKRVSQKEKLNLKIINSLETTIFEKKINYLQKNEINIDSFKKNHKELTKNNKLILKTHQRFKSESNSDLTEEVNIL